MQENIQKETDAISLKEFIEKIKDVWRFLATKWIIIVFFGFVGSAIGLTYAYLIPIKYTSKLTFVVEEGKSGGGGLASLAGQFGFDIGSLTGGSGGVFSGENILLFLKSEGLCREALMTSYNQQGTLLLVDKYIEASKLKKKWLRNKKIGDINFAMYRDKPLPRLEDSLIQIIINDRILKTDLSVLKPDKKASFITVSVSMHDEMLSKLFSERLVKIATKKYVDFKTKVKIDNLNKLQRRADSLSVLLNNKTFLAASSQQVLVDANPAMRLAPINAEISTRDKTMIGVIFSEVVKNLEISKTLLNQETPVIQMVDQSTLPLFEEKVGKIKSLVLGFIFFGFITVFFLVVRRWYKTII